MAENGKTHILPVKHTSYVLQRLNEQRRKGVAKCRLAKFFSANGNLSDPKFIGS